MLMPQTLVVALGVVDSGIVDSVDNEGGVDVV
jgi:hypothetical protein